MTFFFRLLITNLHRTPSRTNAKRTITRRKKTITTFYYHRLHVDDLCYLFGLVVPFLFKWNCWIQRKRIKSTSKRNWMDRSPKKHWMTFLGRQRLLYTTHENGTPKIFYFPLQAAFTHLRVCALQRMCFVRSPTDAHRHSCHCCHCCCGNNKNKQNINKITLNRLILLL